MGVILDGVSHSINGNIIATSTNGGGHNITLENMVITGNVDTSAATGTGATAGNLTMTNSRVTNIISNGANGATTGGNAGTINLTDTSFSSLAANGGIAYGQGGLLSHSGYGGYGGNVTIIKSNGTLDLSSTTINITHGTGPKGYGYHQLLCPGSCSPFNPGSPLTINVPHLTVNNSTYFYGVQALTINGILYGIWNGVFNNQIVLYFNDQATGAGHDGDWNNPLNWWFDSIFTAPSGGIPNVATEIIASGTVSTNSGAIAYVGSAIFNNYSINSIAITALNGFTFNSNSVNNGSIKGPSVFNDSSVNNGTTTGAAYFVGNTSENNGHILKDLISTYNNVPNFYAIASSYDGVKLVGVIQYGQIYTSINSGVTWTLSTSSPSGVWWSVTSSADGTKLVAIMYGGQIYTSTDSGLTWAPHGPSLNWRAIASSADGTKLVAGVSGGQIYTSTNSGVTWNISTSSPSAYWSSIASSADGTKLVATVEGNQIYRSTDSGLTWSVLSSAPAVTSGQPTNINITSSADGTKLSMNGGGNYGNQIFTSTDSGSTWNAGPTWPPGLESDWGLMTSSADGTELAGVSISPQPAIIYISNDSGVTWTTHNLIGTQTSGPVLSFSPNGRKLMINASGNIYNYDMVHSNAPVRQYTTNTNVGIRNFTNQNWIVQAISSQVNLSSATYATSSDTFEALSGGSFISNSNINGGAPVVPQVFIVSPTSGTVVKWLPSINWDTSVICQYSYDNFVTVNTVNCANNGSDIIRPSAAGSQTLYVQGVDVRGDITQKSVTFTYDNTSPVPTACGADILNESTRQYYYLAGNVNGDCVVTTNVKLYGNNPATTSSSTVYTVNGNIIATSTTNGYNIILNNINVTGYVIASGANNPSGIGYNGGNISVGLSVTGPIISNGGNGTTQGGNGGSISILNSAGIASTSTMVSSKGGNATSCGYGGSGGSVSVINSSYGVVSNNAGLDNTLTIANGGSCANPLYPLLLGGSSGSSVVTGTYTPPVVSQPAVTPAPEVTPALVVAPQAQVSSGGSSGSTIIPLATTPTPVEVTQPAPAPKSSFTGTFTQVASAAAQKVADTATAFVNSPASKTVQATSFFAGLVASVSFFTESAFATPIAASEAVLIPARLWGLILMGLGIRRKSRPWGTVYDSVTKQPIDPAYITARDSTGRVVAEAVTDIDGRYGFLLPDGTYYLSVQKTNYVFPSKKLENKQSDELYNDLYFGEPVTVKNGEVIDKNIPMDQKNFDWNQQNKLQTNSSNAPLFHSHNERKVAVASNYIYGIGLIISAIAVAMKPTAFNVLILISYTLILLFVKISVKDKKRGSVKDKVTNQPLSYAIIRVTAFDHQVVLRSTVCDAQGRYYCIVPKGQHFIDIEKKNPDGTYSKVYESGAISNDNGIVNVDFLV